MLQAFWKGTRGNIAIITALALPALLLAGGYSVEFATQVSNKSELQAAADGAAIAATREITLANASSNQILSVARNYLKNNLDLSKGKLAVRAAAVNDMTGVKVVVEHRQKSVFGTLLGTKDHTVRVEAQANVVGNTKICVLGLMDEGILAGVHLDNKAKLTAKDCGVYSNSTSFASIRADSASFLAAQLICAAGGTMAGRSVSFDPEPITDCPQIADPLQQRPAPSVDGCLETDLVVETDTILSPGTYCGGLTIRGMAEVELRSGVYIIKDGPMSVEDEAEIEGEYVGFFLHGEGSVFSFGENTEISLSAPKDGPMAGMLFFEAPDASILKTVVKKTSLFSAFGDLKTLSEMRTHRIKSNNARKLLGTFYLPNSILQIDANAPVADESAYTAIVARRLWLLEGPHLILNTDYAATDVPVPSSLAGGDVRLTQ